MRRAVSVTELMTKKFKLLPFEGEFEETFGRIALTHSMIIWGQSGSGKTSMTLQLCKYLCNYSRVLYNSLEEGAGPTMATAFKRVQMDEVKRKLILIDEPIQNMKERLKKRKSPDVCVIDSIQYSGLNYKQYADLIGDFPSKLFIMVSHADGKEPAGRVAKSIRYDAHIKVRCEGFKAFAASRYGGGKPFIIWKPGADEYWGDILTNRPNYHENL